MSRLSQSLGLVGLFFALASCGPAPQVGGGIGGTGSVTTVSSGPVTKFGSVFVSGTEYDNSRTMYCLDDDPCSSVNRLKLGMVVLVNGTTTEQYANNTTWGRIAETITYEETVEGIVQSIAADGLSLTVLGQVIHINQKTVIDASIPGQSVGTLRPGMDHVEVSGFVVGDGQILATLIMMQTGSLHYEVQGTIKNHDAIAHTFEIGLLQIEYSVSDFSQMPALPWNGLVVHVRGEQWSHSGSGPSGGMLMATRVTLLGLGVEDSAEAELEGFILQVDGPGDFVVNNLRIRPTPSTVYEGGAIGDLMVDTHVIVHGKLAGNILQAEEISFEGTIELEANVLAIDNATKSLTLAGLSGMTVLMNDHTTIDGEDDLRAFEGIRAGAHLQIHGRTNGTSLLATELERSDPTSAVKIQGPVRSVLGTTFIIGGATIDTADIPDDRFLGSDGTIIGRSAFFQSLTAGHTVSLRGTDGNGVVTWTSARRKT